MKTEVGLWIDHRKAIVVTVSGKGEEIALVISAVEKQPRRSASSRHTGAFESQKVQADDSRQRSTTGHLNIYYDAIIASIRDAESILIFGPGEARDELKKRLKKNGLAQRIVGVESADKMTNQQISAKVRARFAE
jgi:hypothetical protein